MMPDRIALNLISLGPADFDARLYAAATAGFAAVGLVWEEIAASPERAAQEIRLADLAVAEVTGIPNWTESTPTAHSLAMVQAEALFEMAADLDCSVVVADPPVEGVEVLPAATAFGDLCRLADRFKVRVGLEFLGPAHSVSTFASAWQIVELADMSNGGLVLDTFHFHRSGCTLEMLESVPAEKVFLVQVSDSVDLPLRELEDRHRVYPGSGVIPLDQLLAALDGKGYSGYYSLELHNEGYWEEDPLVVAREGLRAMHRLDIT